MKKETIKICSRSYGKTFDEYWNRIIELEEENKQLKEKINKAIEYIKSRARNAGVQLMPREKELLEILGDEE